MPMCEMQDSSGGCLPFLYTFRSTFSYQAIRVYKENDIFSDVLVLCCLVQNMELISKWCLVLFVVFPDAKLLVNVY